jgi:RNA-binding protein
MTVNAKQKRFLRGLAHSLKPVVMLGNNGLTESVMAEIDNALNHHELIKVRVSGQERGDRVVMLNNIANKTSSELVHVIGHIGAFYRPAEKPTIELPR